MLGQAAANRPLVSMTSFMAFPKARLFRIVFGSLLRREMNQSLAIARPLLAISHRTTATWARLAVL